MSWLTVVRMMQVKGGFRSPEDSPQPKPDPKQLEPNERAGRIRRIQMNDLESLPFLLIAGFLPFATARSASLNFASRRSLQRNFNLGGSAKPMA